jgi:AraC-like DNA-binding protein
VASALLVRLTRQELARRGLLPGRTVADGSGALDEAAPATSPTVPHAAPRVPSRMPSCVTKPAGALVPPVVPTLGEATVALAPKRSLLTWVAERWGLVPLLEVGRGVGRLQVELPDDPMLAALLRATDPDDAITRWQRLERFVHSRHRIERVDPASDPVGAASAGAAHARAHGAASEAAFGAASGGAAGEVVRLIRHAGPPGLPPSPAEDALVLGVLAELCRRSGAARLAVTLVGPDGREHRILADDHFTDAPPDWPALPGATGCWRFAWWPTRNPPADAASAGRRAVAAWSAPGALPAADRVPTDDLSRERPLVAQLIAVVAADLCRAWTLADVARVLAAAGPSFAPRTLQRRLAAAGATFPGVVRAARVAAAGRMLAERRLALGVIGFACGFADQPHFTRQFKRQLGLTPAAYRRVFARTG